MQDSGTQFSQNLLSVVIDQQASPVSNSLTYFFVANFKNEFSLKTPAAIQYNKAAKIRADDSERITQVFETLYRIFTAKSEDFQDLLPLFFSTVRSHFRGMPITPQKDPKIGGFGLFS